MLQRHNGVVAPPKSWLRKRCAGTVAPTLRAAGGASDMQAALAMNISQHL
jgi:hypothetical protein